MFYVSDIKSNGRCKLVGITDTKDGVTDYYKEDVLLGLLNSGKIGCDIFGTLSHTNELWLSVLTLNKDITANELKHRILNWRKVLSPESKLLVQYYLFEAKIGTAITIAIDKIGDNGQRLKYGIRYVKIDEDSWESNNGYFDTSKGLSGFLLGDSVVALGIGDDDHFDKVVF